MEQVSDEAASELPSIGSQGHSRGLCRPCGFAHHANGCEKGSLCEFCHICPRGTIERQRKTKRHMNRARRQIQLHQGAGVFCTSISDAAAAAAVAAAAASTFAAAAGGDGGHRML